MPSRNIRARAEHRDTTGKPFREIPTDQADEEDLNSAANRACRSLSSGPVLFPRMPAVIRLRCGVVGNFISEWHAPPRNASLNAPWHQQIT